MIRTTTRSRSVGKSALIVALLSLRFLTQIVFSANASLDEGLRAYQRGDFDEAAAKWQKAVEEFRRQANVSAQIKAMTDLAAAYQALGQQKRAVQVLEDASAAHISSRLELISKCTIFAAVNDYVYFTAAC